MNILPKFTFSVIFVLLVGGVLITTLNAGSAAKVLEASPAFLPSTTTAAAYSISELAANMEWSKTSPETPSPTF